MSTAKGCSAEIFPKWSNRWVRCGSPLRDDGTCYSYGHPNPRPVRDDDRPCRCGSTKAAHLSVEGGGCTECPCPGYTTTAREELDLYRSLRAAGAIPEPVTGEGGTRTMKSSDLPDWLGDVQPMTQDEFAAFDRRMADKQHAEDRAVLEPFADWREQTAALQQMEAGLTPDQLRALGIHR